MQVPEQVTVQVITTLGELDAKLAECHEAAKRSDSALREVFTTFRMDFSASLPPDPFSADYHAAQMALYEHISGRCYEPQNEKTKFDIDQVERRPFPYATGSCRTAGFFTMGAGYLLHCLDLAPGARVLEFGPGWGNTTLAMAMIGLDVTAVDIEPDFCELIRRRASRQGVGITVVNADFFWAETVTEPFDAVVFFECFHHCSDHHRLLTALDRAVKPGGRVLFAAEPIMPDFPLPWGLRMDGESLWAIRHHGWMELGFNETYFHDALARAGWGVRKHALPGIEWAAVLEARRLTEMSFTAEPAAPPPPSPSPEDALRAELDAVYRSSSWRLTAPLRVLRRRLG